MSTEVIESEVENEAVEETQTIEESQEPKLTILDQRKLDVCVQLDELYPELREAEENVESLKADMKEAKAYLEKIQGQAAQLMRRLYEIEHGGQQHLPFDDEHPDVAAGKDRPHGTPLLDATAKAMREDKGAKQPIEELGLPKGILKNLKGAELKTVGDLEKLIRENEWWHTDIDGVGPAGVEKIIDALFEHRKTYPVPCEDDEPEDEADTIPFGNDLTWWCSECQHEWPVDGDNPQCPECENETGNYQFGHSTCPDADSLGLIFRNYETVQIIDEDKVKCLVSVYEVPDGGWLSAVVIEDKQTPYMFSNSMNIEDPTSTSRDAALWNRLSKVLENEDTPNAVYNSAREYMELHLMARDAIEQYQCAACQSEYVHDNDWIEPPHCPHCGAAEHTPAD